MRKLPQRHFLSHTAEHLFAVFAVLIVAFTLGYIGKNFQAGPEGQLAQTSGSIGSTTYPYPPTGTIAQVYFNAEQVAIACTNNITKAKYRFHITPEIGGFIILSTPSGPQYIDSANGGGMERYLDVGSYQWSGNIRPGYVGTGGGMISVPNICTNTTAGGTPPPSGTTPPPTTATPPPTTSTPPPPPATPPTDTTIAPPPTTPNLVPVAFAVQPAPTSSCSPTGAVLTPVFLGATKEFGGSFRISSNTGMNNAPYQWGEYYFPNGRYAWTVQVNSGYIAEGALSGTFELTNTCQPNTATTDGPASVINPPPPANPPTTQPIGTPTTTSTVGMPLPPTDTQLVATKPSLPPLPRPVLSMFIDNTPITAPRVFNKEVVEIRITTADSASVDIVTMTGTDPARTHGKAVRDDLLERPGIDVWSYMFDMSEFPEGKAKLQARVKHNDKRETQTEPAPLTVAHPIPQKAPPKMVSPATIQPSAVEGGGTLMTSVRVPIPEKDRKQILARISDPSSCGNSQECEIYCRSLPGVNDLCVSYAREPIATRTPEERSLVDSVPDEVMRTMLASGTERPKELPEGITKPTELKEYCTDVANFEACAKVLIAHDETLDPAILAKKRDIIELARNAEREVFTERIGTRAYYDTDQDGVTDYDEINLYQTDPAEGDSDNDGFTDGAELLARTNPNGGSEVTPTTPSTGSTTPPTKTDESVEFHNPMIAGVTEPELLEVFTVAVAEVGENAQGSTTATKLKFAGKSQPNSFVTIYIFSEPIVVTVKADATGAWTYTLDKELSDGTHQIYSAITDAGGRILAKSEPLPFVKVAEAVSIGTGDTTQVTEQQGFFTGASLYAMIAMLIGILGVALSIIGFIVRQKSASDSAGLPGI